MRNKPVFTHDQAVTELEGMAVDEHLPVALMGRVRQCLIEHKRKPRLDSVPLDWLDTIYCTLEWQRNHE